METGRIVLLVFPQEVMYKPLIYKLAREFDLQFNILEAKILPRREGRLILELKGELPAVERGIAYLAAEGVIVSRIADQIHREEESCVHCGACTAVCRTGALTVEPGTMKVVFNPEKCVACGQCELACPVKCIMGVNIERLGSAIL